MAGALSALFSLDTAALDGKLSLANGSVHAEATLSLRDFDAGRLLGDLAPLLAQWRDLPSDPSALAEVLRQALKQLDGLVDLSQLSAVEEAARVLRELVQRLSRVVDQLGLEPQRLADRLLGDFGGVAGLLGEIAARFAEAVPSELPEALREPVAALHDLAGGELDARRIARFLARFLAGIDLDALSAPAAVLAQLQQRIEHAGGDLEPLRRHTLALTTRIDAACDQLSSGTPDLAALAAELRQARLTFDQLFDELLPGAVNAFAADLEAIQPTALLADLDHALQPFLARMPAPPTTLEETFLEPLQLLAQAADGLTWPQLEERLQEIEAEIDDVFARSEVGVLGEAASRLLDGLREQLRRLPLPEVRAQISRRLHDAEARLRGLELYSPVYDLAQRLDGLSAALDAFDVSSVQPQVAALADQMRAVSDAFPIADLAAELTALLDAAAQAVAGVAPALDQVAAQVDALAGQVSQIELDAAGAASVKLVADLRGKVKEALAAADLPDALRGALGTLAGEIRKIDLSAELKTPFEQAVARIDVGALLAPLAPAIEQARQALGKLAPSALADALDAPYRELLQVLESVNPAALTGALAARFGQVTALTEQLAPSRLVTPLQSEFDRLIAELGQLADPAPLFAPLRAAYAELLGLIDRLDPEPLLTKVLGVVAEMPKGLQQSAKQALTQRAGAPLALPGGSGDAPFHLGDIVRPVVYLVEELRGRVRSAAAGVIDEALRQVSSPLASLRRLAHSASLLAGEAGARLAERRHLLDLAAERGPLADLRAAIDRLRRVEGLLAAEGRSSVELGGAVLALRVDAHLDAAALGGQRLDAVQAALTGGTAGSGTLAASLSRLARLLDEFLPAELTLPDSRATALARLDALFDAIDPSAIAAQMDVLGAKLLDKMQSFARELFLAVLRLVNQIISRLMPLLPQGLLPSLRGAFAALKADLALFDPAGIEAEVRQLRDALLGVLQAFSPAALAGALDPLFAAARGKLAALDPATLLGDLSPLAGVVEQFRALQPSLVLQPLLAQATDIEAALVRLLAFDPGEILLQAVAKLKLELEEILAAVEAELDGLLDDLSGGASGGLSVSASVSV